MSKIKTLTLVGGISSDSLNQKYFKAIESLVLNDFAFETFDISTLPFYSQDIENTPPEAVKEFKQRIIDADAVVLITPEYNRSFPGVLKNALDWGSRPYGQNLWNKKPAAVLGASPGATGTFGAQHHLRQVLAYLNLYVLGQPEVYFGAADKALSDNGKFMNDKTKEIITSFFDTFSEFIQRVSDQSNHPMKETSNQDSSSTLSH